MKELVTIMSIIREVEDPRIDRTKLHDLEAIILIALCSSVCGMTGWEEFEAFGNAKIDWFRKFTPLTNGIPSHDTFRRVFERINPTHLQKVLADWIKTLDICLEGKVVAIDGKSLRSSFDKTSNLAPLHTISAWAVDSRLVLGECEVDKKENEITKIPALLELLELKGAIVTIDAMGCQKEIAKIIVEKNKADYVLALKKNHPGLYDEVQLLFKSAQYNLGIKTDSYESIDKGHGRIETRTCICLEVGKWLGDAGSGWTKFNTVAKLISKRKIKGKETEQIRYFISSLPLDAPKIAKAIRDHWGIENTLHWSLDVVFGEDSIHIRKDNSPKNLSIIRRIAFSLAKPRTPEKMTTKRAQLWSILDPNFADRHFFRV